MIDKSKDPHVSSRTIKTDAASTCESARDDAKSTVSGRVGSECAGLDILDSGGNDSAAVPLK